MVAIPLIRVGVAVRSAMVDPLRACGRGYSSRSKEALREGPAGWIADPRPRSEPDVRAARSEGRLGCVRGAVIDRGVRLEDDVQDVPGVLGREDRCLLAEQDAEE